MNYREITKREVRDGYVLITGWMDGSEFGSDDFIMTHAETPDGHYIGDSETARMLCDERGIAPEPIKPGHGICSIGFSAKDGKWYGWSHRAVFGFQVGSTVRKGDCAYVPENMEDARQDAIRFWSDDSHRNVDAVETRDDEGKACFDVTWTYSDDPELVPNADVRSKISGTRHYPPDTFGQGEWTAETMEDAKQMACDFAEGVA